MADSYEFLKAHFDRIQADQIAARVELLEAARAAAVFLDSIEWTDSTSETNAANVQHRLEAAISEIEGE
jgi:hypothetical protein